MNGKRKQSQSFCAPFFFFYFALIESSFKMDNISKSFSLKMFFFFWVSIIWTQFQCGPRGEKEKHWSGEPWLKYQFLRIFKHFRTNIWSSSDWEQLVIWNVAISHNSLCSQFHYLMVTMFFVWPYAEMQKEDQSPPYAQMGDKL